MGERWRRIGEMRGAEGEYPAAEFGAVRSQQCLSLDFPCEYY